MEHDDGQLLISYLGRHLLCLYIRYRAIDADGTPVGPEYQSATSCFVIELLDEWHLTTAGHVFHNPERRDGFDDMIEDKARKEDMPRTGLVSIELHALMRQESRPFLFSSSGVAAAGRMR
ncbi:MAG: hypothetical protein WCL32_23630 [Planctomycetota bacterium]|jgi:hypothetical protein